MAKARPQSPRLNDWRGGTLRAWRRSGSTAEVEAALAAVGLGLDSPLSSFRPTR